MAGRAEQAERAAGAVDQRQQAEQPFVRLDQQRQAIAFDFELVACPSHPSAHAPAAARVKVDLSDRATYVRRLPELPEKEKLER